MAGHLKRQWLLALTVNGVGRWLGIGMRRAENLTRRRPDRYRGWGAVCSSLFFDRLRIAHGATHPDILYFGALDLARDSADEIACPNRVAPSVWLSAPLYALPIGVRAVETITASVMAIPLVGYDSRIAASEGIFSFAARTASDDRQDRQTGC